MSNAPRKRTMAEMALIAAAMFGFGFLMVPLYKALCDIAGINGRNSTMQIAANTVQSPDLSRWVTVEFTTTVNGGHGWDFSAKTEKIAVHPGQLYTVNFLARSQSDAVTVAQAVPSILPMSAAKHLKKTECFCFRQQPFAPHEQKLMPVRFMLERDLPADVNTVVLAYTFFDVTSTASAATVGLAESKTLPHPALAQPSSVGKTISN